MVRFVTGEIYFNYIYVIQSLGSNDKETGREIYEDTIKTHLFRHSNVESELLDISTKQEMLNLLKRIISDTKYNKVLPFIHFEMHGNEEGLALKSKERLSFKELFDFLLEINIASKNNLFISVASCWGGYIQHILDIRKPCPFRGFIGPMSEISQGDIHIRFTAFFEAMLAHSDVSLAIHAITENIENTIPFNYVYAEEFFEILKRKKLLEYQSDPAILDKELTKIIKGLWKTNSQSKIWADTRVSFIKKMKKESKISITDIMQSIENVFLHKVDC